MLRYFGHIIHDTKVLLEERYDSGDQESMKVDKNESWMNTKNNGQLPWTEKVGCGQVGQSSSRRRLHSRHSTLTVLLLCCRKPLWSDVLWDDAIRIGIFTVSCSAPVPVCLLLMYGRISWGSVVSAVLRVVFGGNGNLMVQLDFIILNSRPRMPVQNQRT